MLGGCIFLCQKQRGLHFPRAKLRGGCIFEVDFGRGLHFQKREEDFSNINNDLSIYSSIESTSISPDMSLGSKESLSSDNR